MLHTCHETHSRGKGSAPQDELGTLVQHHQLLHRGSPGPLLFLWHVKSSLVPYKPLPRSLEHRGDKNDRAGLGERDSEKPHTAKDFWALRCGRGSIAQIPKNHTTPHNPLPWFWEEKPQFSINQQSEQMSPVPATRTAAFWKGFAVIFNNSRINPIRCKLPERMVTTRWHSPTEIAQSTLQ